MPLTIDSIFGIDAERRGLVVRNAEIRTPRSLRGLFSGGKRHVSRFWSAIFQPARLRTESVAKLLPVLRSQSRVFVRIHSQLPEGERLLPKEQIGFVNRRLKVRLLSSAHPFLRFSYSPLSDLIPRHQPAFKRCLGVAPGQNRERLLLRDGVCGGGNAGEPYQTLRPA